MRPFDYLGFYSTSVTLLTYPFEYVGGDEEDRTPDPLRARQVLSQLSYTPIFQGLGLPLHLFKILKVRTFKIEQQILTLQAFSLLTEDMNLLQSNSP